MLCWKFKNIVLNEMNEWEAIYVKLSFIFGKFKFWFGMKNFKNLKDFIIKLPNYVSVNMNERNLLKE